MNPSSSMIVRVLAGVAAGVALSSTASAQGFADNFNSGPAAAWTPYSPLAAFGAGTTATGVSGGYRIEAAGSPAPGLVGPGRGGAFRTDQTFSDFAVGYDLTEWGSTPFFAGAFARVQEIGLGTLDGYALGFDFSVGRLFISRLVNESVDQVVIASDVITLDPAKDYRLTFRGVGSELSGQISEVGSGTVVASILGNDTAHTSGFIGLGLAVQSATAGVGATATFDNVVAAVPEPSVTALLGLGGMALLLGRRGRCRVG